MNATRMLVTMALASTACHPDRRAASTALRQYYECVTVAGPPTTSMLEKNARLEACLMSKEWSHDSASAIAGGFSEILLAGLTETAKHGKAAGDSVMKAESARSLRESRLKTMKTGLRDLVVSEETYFADNVKYTKIVDCSPSSRGAILCLAPGNVLGPITLTNDGWTATMTNSKLPGVTCAIFVGPRSIAPATKEGSPTCDSSNVSSIQRN